MPTLETSADRSADRSTDRTTLAQLLETLRLSVHLAFAALLVVALVQFLARGYSPAHQVAVAAVSALLAVVYLVGTVWENRFAAGRTSRDLRRLTGPWLAVVLGLWILLVVLSADAVWLLFPLVFVSLALTGPWTGGLTVAACWAVVAVVPVLTGQRTGVGGIIGSGIGVLFAALTYWTYLRLTREAEHQRRIAEQLRATRDRLLAAENQAGRFAERERFSREIHDTLAQGFNSVLLLSRAARTALDQGRVPDAADQIEVITTTAHDNLVQTRALVAEGARAGSVPLVAALRQLTQDATRRARALGAEVTVELDTDDFDDTEDSVDSVGSVDSDGLGDSVLGTGDPSGTVAGVLLRVAQEAVANAVTHADASHIRLTLGVWDTEATLDIFDDGRGFDPAAVQRTATSGFGLSGMRQRVAEINGELTVDSTVSGVSGTVVAVRVPITQGGAL